MGDDSWEMADSSHGMAPLHKSIVSIEMRVLIPLCNGEQDEMWRGGVDSSRLIQIGQVQASSRLFLAGTYPAAAKVHLT